MRVAQLFYTLRTAVEVLETKYTALASTDGASLPCFPHITSYGKEPNVTEIKYKKRIDCSDTRKVMAIFTAEDSEGNPLFVKFTSRYNEEAHRLLAQEGYAPTLRHCSETVAGSGYFIVVMDRIDGEHMFGSGFTAEDLLRVRQAKDLLHQHNFVFGDLRPNNIVKPADGSGVMLVDFDWCALAGEGKYPLTINSDPSCGWHPEVGPGVVMRKEHDEYLYARLHRSSL
jgi:serine/threonine protein kinase